MSKLHDMLIKHEGERLDMYQDWFKSVSIDRIQKPNQYRITLIIDFIKDFERLQTYYAAFLK